MAYEPTNWKTGDVVTSAKLNKLEQAVAGGGMLTHTPVNKTATVEWIEWGHDDDYASRVVIADDWSITDQSAPFPLFIPKSVTIDSVEHSFPLIFAPLEGEMALKSVDEAVEINYIPTYDDPDTPTAMIGAELFIVSIADSEPESTTVIVKGEFIELSEEAILYDQYLKTLGM